MVLQSVQNSMRCAKNRITEFLAPVGGCSRVLDSDLARDEIIKRKLWSVRIKLTSTIALTAGSSPGRSGLVTSGEQLEVI